VRQGPSSAVSFQFPQDEVDLLDGGASDPSEPTTFREFVSAIAQAHGLSVERAPSIPYGLAFGAGWIVDMAGMVTSAASDPPMSRSMVRLIGREFVTSDERARNQLGYVGHVTRAQGLETYGQAPG
jgi:nucleoside-diphosphate-sugar epimerase